jgi:hypothetical protein
MKVVVLNTLQVGEMALPTLARSGRPGPAELSPRRRRHCDACKRGETCAGCALHVAELATGHRLEPAATVDVEMHNIVENVRVSSRATDLFFALSNLH